MTCSARAVADVRARAQQRGAWSIRTYQTNDSKHWRDRAAQIRGIAITMQGTEVAILMGDLANDYDKIADKNERQPTKENKRNWVTEETGS